MAELKWKKSKNPKPCWSGELRVDFSRRRFYYENFYINADELFKHIPKEDEK